MATNKERLDDGIKNSEDNYSNPDLDNNDNRSKSNQSQKSEDKDRSKVEIKDIQNDEKLYYLAKNDEDWANENWLFFFDKYINPLDSTKDVDIDKYLWSIMKDLHVFFEIKEIPQILENAKLRLKGKNLRPLKFFKQELYKYIAEYRKYKIDETKEEGQYIVDNAFKKHYKALLKHFESKNKEDPDYLSINNMSQIIADFENVWNWRLLCLDHNRPKDNSSIVSEIQEKEYADMIEKLAKSNKISKITIDNLKAIIMGYLKANLPKYSFTHVPRFDDQEGLDPYADHGDVGPGESKVLQKKSFNDEYIDQQINEAEQDNLGKKVKLLKKIKQLQLIKSHAQRVSEEESINMMIENTYEEIRRIDEEQEQYEGEGEGEGDFYEGEQDDETQPKDNQSHLSRYQESLEERREKGLKEIFDHYARSQMLIGRKATFDLIQHEISNLNLGEYMKFIKDFKIPCSKTKTAEVFKKTATNSKELFFDDFKNTLWKLFEMRDKEEIEKLKKRLREIRKIQRKRDEPQESKEKEKEVKQEDKKDAKKSKELSPNDDLRKEVKSDKPQTDSEDESKKVEEKSQKPQIISRPKGGDPKNVEILQSIQKDRK